LTSLFIELIDIPVKGEHLPGLPPLLMSL
jgi:hypothetical protein